MPGIEISSNGDELENHISVTDIADLLMHQYVIVTGLFLITLNYIHFRDHTCPVGQIYYFLFSGGKSKERCPIITFPDNGLFHLLSDENYKRLISYITIVPS